MLFVRLSLIKCILPLQTFLLTLWFPYNLNSLALRSKSCEIWYDCEYMKIHQIVYFDEVYSKACEFYLHKAVINKQTYKGYVRSVQQASGVIGGSRLCFTESLKDPGYHIVSLLSQSKSSGFALGEPESTGESQMSA